MRQDALQKNSEQEALNVHRSTSERSCEAFVGIVMLSVAGQKITVIRPNYDKAIIFLCLF
jgi:hypothetical protein